jgi:hypothetical protein
MSKVESGHPAESEYAVYYGRYVGKIEGTDIVAVLEEQLESTLPLLRGIDERTANYRYEPGKWSVKEVLGHIIDGERVFAYRALTFARNDTTALPSFDQDKWAESAPWANLPISHIVAEFEAVRRANIFMFRQCDAAAWGRTGVANEKPMTTRSAAFVIAGHLQHHLEILKTRYLGK